MEQVVERLARWMWTHAPKRLDALAPGATDDQLAACEAAVGTKLPEALRALLKWRNGTRDGVFESAIADRELLSTDRIARHQQMMNDLLDQGNFAKDWWRKSWFPVLDNGCGDSTCIDFKGGFGGEPGQVIEFWHESPDRKIVAPSFDGWLTAYVDALEGGLWVDAEGAEYDNIVRFHELIAKRFPGHPFQAIDFEGRRGKRPPPPPPPVAADPTRLVKVYAPTTS